MASDDLACWSCGESLNQVPRPISRHEQCPACFEALHCCRMCRHYRTDITGQCDEDRADPPVVKENANFCDWFRPSRHAFSGRRVQKSTAARDRLDALFGGADEASAADDAPRRKDTPSGDDAHQSAGEAPLTPEDEARRKLDDLFPGG